MGQPTLPALPAQAAGMPALLKEVRSRSLKGNTCRLSW